MTERNVQWVVCEMTSDMKQDVEKQVNAAIDKTDTEKEIAESPFRPHESSMPDI